MNIDELLALDRALTDEEAAFMEQELLKTARELQAMAEAITAEIPPEHQHIAEHLRNATRRTVQSIEAAVELEN